MKSYRKGMSMLELLIGVVIFALGMMPILWLGSAQTRGAWSTGKHMMAGQVAASFIDSLMALPYRECLERARQIADLGKARVLDNEDIIAMLARVDDESIRNDMEISFRYFTYSLNVREDAANKVIRLDMEVFYHVLDGEPSSEQSLKLSVLKFGDRNV